MLLLQSLPCSRHPRQKIYSSGGEIRKQSKRDPECNLHEYYGSRCDGKAVQAQVLVYSVYVPGLR